MPSPILYCGDTHLHSAAAYLAGLLSAWQWPFEYVASDQPLATDTLDKDFSLVIFSDYPSANLDPAVQQRLIESVAGGCGLLMIGGWESFHGLGGDWDQTALADVLPVEISRVDDRLNCDHPVVVRRIADHESVAGLPWQSRPPLIGGLNRFVAKQDSVTVLQAEHFSVCEQAGGLRFEPTTTDPLLVLGQYHQGRTAAFATDVAPHWVGGLVDWGDGRVAGQAADADAIEVGDLYSQFFRQLLTWLREPASA